MKPTCPKCGKHEFYIDVVQTATVEFFDGHEVVDPPYGDIIWGDDLTQCKT